MRQDITHFVKITTLIFFGICFTAGVTAGMIYSVEFVGTAFGDIAAWVMLTIEISILGAACFVVMD